MLDIRVHPEPASLILDLCAAPEQRQISDPGLIVRHIASRAVLASEGIELTEANRALRRCSCGLPGDDPRLRLDGIRSDAAALRIYINNLLEDKTWLQDASDIALKYIPWRNELRRIPDCRI
jgi:hypothetical protein